VSRHGSIAFSQILWGGEIGYVQAFFDGTPAFSENSDTVPCSDLRSAAFFGGKPRSHRGSGYTFAVFAVGHGFLGYTLCKNALRSYHPL
jgi:hypothetical protein